MWTQEFLKLGLATNNSTLQEISPENADFQFSLKNRKFWKAGTGHPGCSP